MVLYFCLCENYLKYLLRFVNVVKVEYIVVVNYIICILGIFLIYYLVILCYLDKKNMIYFVDIKVNKFDF